MSRKFTTKNVYNGKEIKMDGDKEAYDDAFYAASELATMVAKPRSSSERMLFRSRRQQ